MSKSTYLTLTGAVLFFFIFPAVIINSIAFLGFPVIWSFWSHLFVVFDLFIVYVLTKSVVMTSPTSVIVVEEEDAKI